MVDAPLHSPQAAGPEPLSVGEFVAAIWSRKRWILLCTILGLTLAVFYIRMVTPLYTAEAIIALSQEKQIPSGMSEISALAGLDSSDPSKQVMDRIMARDFIKIVSDDLNLQSDAYLNPPKPDGTGLRGAIKSFRDALFGARPAEPDIDVITRTYKKNVTAFITKGGSINIRVVHVNSQQSALIANKIASLTLDVLKEDARRDYMDQQEYLVDLLRQAQDDIDRTRQQLSQIEGRQGNNFTLFQLQRDARIAEAVYNTLIEKVQTQMAIAGYRGESGVIYQSASPQTRPSRPSIVLNLAVGLLGGATLGTALAFASALATGALFTRSAILKAVGAKHDIQASRKIERAGSVSHSLRTINRISGTWVNELLWAINGTGPRAILVIPTGQAIHSVRMSLLIGRLLSKNGKRVVVILLGLKVSDKPMVGAGAVPFEDLSLVHREEGLDVLCPPSRGQGENALISPDLVERIRLTLKEGQDTLVLAVAEDMGPAAAMALRDMDPVSILVTKAGATTSHRVSQIKSAINPDINVNV